MFIMKINKWFYYLVIIVAGILLIGNNLDKSFIGHHDFNSVYYSNIARNYLRYGYIRTNLAQVTNSGYSLTPDFNYHTHHPSLFPILISISFRLFGITETAARLVPLLFSLGSVLMLYCLAKKLRFTQLAALSSAFVIMTPMLRYFGKMPVHEPLILFFSLLSLVLYINLVKKPSRINLIKFSMAALFNGLSGWPGYFLYPLIILHSFFFHRRLWKRVATGSLMVGIAFLIHLLQTYLVTNSFFGGGLFTALLTRLNLNSGLSQVNWIQYLIQEARWLTVYYTRGLLLAGIGFISFTGIKLLKVRKLNHTSSIIVLLFIFALCYPIIFPNAVFIHDYLNIFFLPFFSLSLAWLINQLHKKSILLALTAVILLGINIFSERLPFIQANQNSNMHQTGYELGKLINQIVPPTESVIIFSIDYANHHGVFIRYYADHQLSFAGYGQDGLDLMQQQYPQVKHAFTVLTHRLDNQLVDKVLAFRSVKMQNFGDFNYYQLTADDNID